MKFMFFFYFIYFKYTRRQFSLDIHSIQVTLTSIDQHVNIVYPPYVITINNEVMNEKFEAQINAICLSTCKNT